MKMRATSPGRPVGTAIPRRSARRRRATAVAGATLALSAAGAPWAMAATGDLDPGFSGDGLQATAASTRNATATTIGANGALFVAGNGGFADGSASLTGVYVGKYSSDGTLDPTFGTGGLASFTVTPGLETVRDVVTDASGRVLVTGYSPAPASDPSDTADGFVARLTPTGALDPTFGGGDGIATIDLGNHDRVGGIAISGPRILVGVSQDDGGNWANKWTLLALTGTGAVDTTFSGDGKAEIPTTKLGSFDGLRDIAVQADGKVLLGGTTGSSYAVARLTKTGTLDTTWDKDGVAVTPMTGEGYQLVQQADGKVLLAGYATQTGHPDNDFAAVRYTSKGALDTTFSGDGRAYVDFGAAYGERATSALAAADGKIVLGGYANGPAGMDFGVARLNNDGTLDTSFSTDGLVTTSTNTVANEQIEAMALGAADRIYAVGENPNGWSLAGYTGGANLNLSVADVRVTEGNTGKPMAVFTVTLSDATTSTVTAAYATSNGTATVAKDYVKTAGKVTFAPGQTTRTISVPIIADKVKEKDETFTLTLSIPSNAGLSDASAVGTIANDD